ncbi:hypothetical protein BN2476_270040 [Paraburkholderia piptadeniae]|uniref:Uncharacterized protein n=1 Tax=Paraburkholderia piptadeniae TaxID=1701573 RepID=A0A1N7S1K4_9BURK|nr:hypothetical protein BN2476_270040 [Paraburkholderia piptadeniae]
MTVQRGAVAGPRKRLREKRGRFLLAGRGPCRQGIRGDPRAGPPGGQAGACAPWNPVNAALCERECLGPSHCAVGQESGPAGIDRQDKPVIIDGAGRDVWTREIQPGAHAQDDGAVWNGALRERRGLRGRATDQLFRHQSGNVVRVTPFFVRPRRHAASAGLVAVRIPRRRFNWGRFAAGNTKTPECVLPGTPDVRLPVTQTGSVSEALLIILLTTLGTPPLLFRYAVRLVRPPGRSALTSRQDRITRARLDGHTELVDFRMRVERARPDDQQDRADDQNAHVRLPPHGQGSHPNLSPAPRGGSRHPTFAASFSGPIALSTLSTQLVYRLSQLALPARAGAGFAEQYRRRGGCRCWTFLCDFNVPHAGTA